MARGYFVGVGIALASLTLWLRRGVSALGCGTSEPFLNGGFTGGIGFFLVNVLIGNLHLTLLFFLGIISSIVEENAYAL